MWILGLKGLIILVVTDFSALQCIVSANLTWFNRNCNTIMLFMIKHDL